MNILLVLNPIRQVSFRDYWFSGENPNRMFDNIVKISDNFDRILITRDCHCSTDDELKFLPKHGLVNDPGSELDQNFLCRLDEDKTFIIKRKDTLSALHYVSQREFFLEHALKGDNITVGGFSLTLDIVPTMLDLIQEGYLNVRTNSDIVDDISSEYKEISLNYLRILGVLK